MLQNILDSITQGGALLIPYLMIIGAGIGMMLPGSKGGATAPAEYIVTLTRK